MSISTGDASSIFLQLFSSFPLFGLNSVWYMPARSIIQALLLIVAVIKLISHQMATLSRSAPDPTLAGVTVFGGRGSSGTCWAIIFRSTGAMLLTGLSMQTVLVCLWEQRHGLALSLSFHVQMVSGLLVRKGM
jgi:hypothetical protein